jgi:hypothetical protein
MMHVIDVMLKLISIAFDPTGNLIERYCREIMERKKGFLRQHKRGEVDKHRRFGDCNSRSYKFIKAGEGEVIPT